MYEAVFPDLARFDRIALDTETTGLKHTSVPVGLSYALPDGKKHYLAWGHQGGENNCSIQQVRDWARHELKRPDLEKVFFNAQYDIRMMYNVGVDLNVGIIEDASTMCALLDEHDFDTSLGYKGKRYLGRQKSDTELNAKCAQRFGGAATRDKQAKNYWRAPASWVAEYAEDDADLTLSLGAHLTPLLIKEELYHAYAIECELLPVLVRMYRAGVRVSMERAQQIYEQLDNEYRGLEKDWLQYAQLVRPGGFKHSARNDLIALFLKLGIVPPRNKPTEKMLEKGIKQGNYSVDKNFLETVNHPLGKLLRRMRQVTHYRDTFVESYIFENYYDGFIYPQFHPTKSDYGGTITGRFSSAGGLNAQNVPARDEEWAALIRSMFIPTSPDHVWLRADYSQIEYRFFAHYAGGKMRQAFIADPYADFHQMVAEMTGLKRKAAKSINFAKLYGAGLAKLAATIGCSMEEAQEFIDTYEARIPEAKKAYDKAMNLGSTRGFVYTWLGRKARFRRAQNGKFFLHTHAALNKVLQGSSADMTKLAMIEVDKEIDWQESPMHLTVHDELDFSVPRGQRGIQIAENIQDIMQEVTVPHVHGLRRQLDPLTVPIVAEMELGEDWGHCVELDEYRKQYAQAA